MAAPLLLCACAAAQPEPLPRSTEPAPSAAASAPVGAPAASSPGSSADAAAPAPSASASAEASAPPIEAPAPEATGPLGAFHQALIDLGEGRRQTHVRVAWLGDSHAQADFWTGALRAKLQARFGDGGPGYLYLGYKNYRHDAAKITLSGSWLATPKAPSTSVVTGDGTFGLGGIRFRPGAGAQSVRVVATSKGLTSDPPASVSFDLCYRMSSDGDALEVSLGSSKATVTPTLTEPAGSLQHLVLRGDASQSLTVTPTRGKPELCGVVIEKAATAEGGAGVVLDTLGINGARYGTALAWDEDTWAPELRRRAPDLVVLEYGTNELSDYDAKPSTHVRRMGALVDRLRRHSGASCLIVAPTDRADRESIEPALVAALEQGAAEKGCAFWDTFAVMGGVGGIRAMAAESPPRAARDGIHLTPRGYEFLGERLYDDLVRDLPPGLGLPRPPIEPIGPNAARTP